MSWDPYTDQLIDKCGFDKAAIVGLDGSVWAEKNVQIRDTEGKTVCTAFTSADGVRSSGIHFGGEKYMYIQSDDSQMQGKKGNKGGISIAKANTCVIIGIYGEGMTPGNARIAVEKIRDYLQGLNY